MKTINGSKFYNVTEVAEQMGVHVQTIRKMISQGKLRAVRIGYMDYISEASVNAYLGITTEA
jgi:excisionase family DNA binding protein